MNDNRVCILGGTGFVGRHLVHRLARHGYRVTVLTRRVARHRDLAVGPAIRLVEADIHAAGALQQVLPGHDAVINLVGILNESGTGQNSFRQVHAELPERVAAAAAECDVGRLLHMSALHADAGESRSRYLHTKGVGEDHAHTAGGDRVTVTSFRPSVIFGPGDSFFNRFAALLKLAPGIFPLACPDSRFAPVYVGDVAEAFCLALGDATTFGRRLELCGPAGFTLRQLVEYTRDLIGVHCRVVGLGDGLSRLQARVLGLLPGKPFSLDNYYSLQHASVCTDNALPAFGIEPVPVEASVPGYLAGRSLRARYHRYRRDSRR